MGIAERNKGKEGERELARKLTEFLADNGIALENKIQRSQQFAGMSGDPDVRGVPGLHCECKRVEHLNVHAAYRQAVEDHRPDTIPTVMHRMSRDIWKVTLSLEDFMKLYSAAYKAGVFDG